MFNFQTARKNMVDCQIHPSGVIDPRILQAFETVPRENYISPAANAVAYADEDIVFDDGRFMLDPTVHARMIQALEPKNTDIVLDVGCANGYSAAILSLLAGKIVAIEDSKKCMGIAEKNWVKAGLGNITPIKTVLNRGCAEHAPYDLIFVNGACAQIPDYLVGQLKPGGRMILIVCPSGKRVGHVTLVEHAGNGQYSSRQLFEAASPYLQGFQPEPIFRF